MKNRHTRQDWFEILFDYGESVCLASDPHGWRVYSVEEAMAPDHNFLFYSLNPLNGTTDNNPTESWHKSTQPRRADVNCTRFSNLLIEFDTCGLGKQLDALKLSGLLDICGGVLFSGSKSLHCIIALEESFISKEKYSEFAAHFLKAVAQVTGIDPDFAVKNVSRLTRCPCSLREKDGTRRKQSIIYLGHRIKFAVLANWLIGHGFTPFPEPKIQPIINITQSQYNESYNQNLRPRTVKFLKEGAPTGSVHIERYAAVCDMAQAGMDFDSICCWVEEVVGIPNRNAMLTMQDAYDRAVRERIDHTISNDGDIRIGKSSIIDKS